MVWPHKRIVDLLGDERLGDARAQTANPPTDDQRFTDFNRGMTTYMQLLFDASASLLQPAYAACEKPPGR